MIACTRGVTEGGGVGEGEGPGVAEDIVGGKLQCPFSTISSYTYSTYMLSLIAYRYFFGHICSGDNCIYKPYTVCLPYIGLSLTDPIHIRIHIHYLPYIYGR